ncbi:uncharacterized protein LOC135378868 isoform X1 [Ornithodoros turicata]|uniref:uncharacterized protein LOC135378868 isoform X1 n=2 Tax=Ornithodoros turicata TaxID=34597 RepID=UPI003138FB14
MMVVVIMLCLLWGAAVAKGNGIRTTVNLPDEIAFQVYVAFDNVLHTAFSNEREAQKYAVVFFNAINLIFQNMTNPKIKFEVVMFHGQFLNFTGPALTLESNEVDAHKSLTSIDKFITGKAQFDPSDILFVFSGRKVFTRGPNNNKEYLPQGLTWERGICNRSRKIVIVSDIGKHFQALPNAGFQLARLLGAPTACTPNFYKLGQDLFRLSECAMKNITKNIEKLQRDHRDLAGECFRRRYQRPLSFHYLDLPYTMVDEDDFCVAVLGKPGLTQHAGTCNRHGMQEYFNEIYDTAHERNMATSKNTQCVFDCCMLDILTTEYKFHSYYAFDGKPCGELFNNRNRRNCVLGACVAQNYTLPF